MEAQLQRPSLAQGQRRKKKLTKRQVDDIPDIASTSLPAATAEQRQCQEPDKSRIDFTSANRPVISMAHKAQSDVVEQTLNLADCTDTNMLWDSLHRAGDSALVTRISSIYSIPDQPSFASTAAQIHNASIQPMYPSAPPSMAVDMPQLAFAPLVPTAPSLSLLTAPQLDTCPISNQSLSIEPKVHDADHVKGIVSDTISSMHDTLVHEFRSHINRLGEMDPFYEKVLLYDTAFKNTLKVRSQLNAARHSAKNLSNRLWRISRTPKHATAVCSDGRQVSHTYTDEDAVYSSDVEKDLRLSWENSRLLYHVHLNKALFESKMAKIWIQNTLDVYLSSHFKSQLELIQSKPFTFAIEWENMPSTDPNIRQLLYYLDVLFSFERRRVLASPSKSPGTPVPLYQSTPDSQGSFATPFDPSGEEPSLFYKDVRSWISYVVAAIIRLGSPDSHRKILLHAIRCPGIGLWGSHFIQWPSPPQWTKSWIQQYLASLRALLGPIEELEEAHAQTAMDEKFVTLNLKRLEVEDEWVVIDQHLFTPFSPDPVVYLREDDYMRLLAQFNISSLFESLMFYCMMEHSKTNGLSDLHSTLLAPPVFSLLFFFADNILGLFKLSLQSIPHIYASFLKGICEHTVTISNTMACYLPLTTTNHRLEASYQPPHLQVQAEFEAFVLQLVKVLLQNGQLGFWEYLVQIPIENLSEQCRRILFTTSISSKSYFNMGSDSSQESLSFVFLSNPEHVDALLKFLVALIWGSQTFLRENASHNSHLDTLAMHRYPETVLDVAHLIDTIFDSCLLQPAIQEMFVDTAASCLADISTWFPFSMSHILKATWLNFVKLESILQKLFSNISLQLFSIDSEDIDILKNLLNDPLDSKRFQFAMFIISRLDWNALTDKGSMLIPQRHQKALAIHLVHRAIDSQSAKEARSGIISTTSAVTLATVEMVSKQIFPFAISTMFSGFEKGFLDWCWNTILSMNLYQIPGYADIYSASPYDRPFESLDGSLMGSLLVHSKSNALVALVLLLISEIGHHPEQFQTHGWSLLSTILSKGPIRGFMHVSFLVIRHLSTIKGIDVFGTAEFIHTFKNLYKTSLIVDSVGIRDTNNQIGIFVTSTLREATEHTATPVNSRFTANFWLRTVFADAEWSLNMSSLTILDVVCEYYIRAGLQSTLHGAFIGEYHALLANYQKNCSKPFNFSYLRPVESIYSLAGALDHIWHTYPTLIPPLVSTSTAGKAPFVWLAYEALIAESLSERPLVQLIGRALSQDLKLTVQQALANSHHNIDENNHQLKPLESFSIFRWASLIFQLPLHHPAMPLFWQGFFSLYFERPFAVPLHSSFGYRFLISSSLHLSQLMSVLDQLNIHKISSEFHDTHPQTLYQAMQLWLSEPQLRTAEWKTFTTDGIFLLDWLQECNIFDTSKADTTWVRLIRNASLDRQSTLFPTNIAEPISSTASSHNGIAAHHYAVETSIDTNRHAVSATPHLKGVSAGLKLYGLASAPPFVLRFPLIPPAHVLTENLALEMFETELAVLIKAAQAYISHVSRIEKLQTECLENLRQLYTTSKRLIRVERACSSGCSGHAIVQCDLQEASINLDMRNLAGDLAQQADLMLLADFLDSSLCTSGLKIIGVIDWLARSEQHELSLNPLLTTSIMASSSQIKEKVFFDVIQSLCGISVYAPAAFLAEMTTRQLGPSVVALSEDQTIRIFEIINKGEAVNLLAKLFDPCCSPDNFPRFYRSLSLSLNSADFLLISKAFDLKRWLNELSQRTQAQKTELFYSVLSACEKTKSFDFHNEMMVQLFVLDQPGIWTECIPVILKAAMRGNIDISIIIGLTVSFLPESREKMDLDNQLERFLASSSLTSLTLIHMETTGLWTKLIDVFQEEIISSGFADSNSNCMLEPLYLGCVVLVALSMQNDIDCIQFIETSQMAMSLFSPWMLLDRNQQELSSTTYSVSRKREWTEKNAVVIDKVISLYFKLLSKLCTMYNRSESLLSLIWKFHADAIGANVNPIFLKTVQKLASKYQWSTFTMSITAIDSMNQWLTLDALMDETGVFAVNVFRDSIKPAELASMPAVWQFVFGILYLAGKVWPVDSDRFIGFQSLTHWLTSVDFSHLPSTSDYEQVVRALPLEWNEQATTTLLNDTTSHFPIVLSLALLRKLGGLEGGQLIQARENLLVYVNFVWALVETQIKADQVPLLLRSIKPNFALDHICGIVCETLQIAEHFERFQSDNLAHDTLTKSVLLASIQSAIALLNSCHKESKICTKLWNGIIAATQESNYAMLYLMAAYRSMSLVEHMAMLSEYSISKHFALCMDPQQWNMITDILQIPELDEAVFIRHCLNHALAFTLYAYSLKTLAISQTKIDEKVMLGERLGVWIVSIRIEHVFQGQECKILLLLFLFGQLLQAELSSLSEGHSRLKAHLPLVGDALFRWSEDRSCQGIWATLGFRPVSLLSVEFRFCARMIALFITSCLIDPDADEQQTQLMDSFTKMQQNSEYGKLGNAMSDSEALLKNTTKGLHQLPDIIDNLARRFFPIWETLVKMPDGFIQTNSRI
ncbi:hypothetical protein BATDEDRAFT_34587 [Batrachochytrium dendrobatidis JAM81]|uniref:Epg5-like TPR domain-containing protein n=1 Tax=Batrachochytrium dendrobatidis (strain JAM81 / FGSC 10211) TaxID=684364 RepID=F4NZ04_BATDJ|nr:uncharacterized protein BATDEDRAFT_34587 [Batrachochytrium dendrobatidis JAM81]EGF82119.1 hypothetical protein BATDEDRAFT_34587 [Batrachochytrium dendrobatidis JAM81]|eukprot:XP_006677414.1 hypothetical protein BATDEDRAFT_34587 [Batrachochytrium dendrobatidis JAM81]